jgi:putative peptidoglycan lipid II flippase
MIDTVLASFLATGSRTALYYADRINQLPLGVLGIALGTVLLPEMSSRIAIGDKAGSDAAQNRSAALSLLLTLPFAAVFVAIPGTIMAAIFAHGAFDRGAAELSAVALATYGIGLPAFALVRIVASTFYARHDTLTPARATFVSIAVNIALKILFVWGFGFGIAGIALGTSLGAWVNVAQLVFVGRRKGLLQVDAAFRRAVLPILAAALAAGGGAYAAVMFGNQALPSLGTYHDATLLAFAGIVGILAYIVIVLLWRRRLPLGRLSLARVT